MCDHDGHAEGRLSGLRFGVLHAQVVCGKCGEPLRDLGITHHHFAPVVAHERLPRAA